MVSGPAGRGSEGGLDRPSGTSGVLLVTQPANPFLYLAAGEEKDLGSVQDAATRPVEPGQAARNRIIVEQGHS